MLKKKEPEVKDQSLYVLLNKDDNSFFIGYCGTENVYDAFRKHYSMQYSKTKEWIEKQKNENKKPCIFILETLNGTRQNCYTLSLIWTKIFLENNFKSIETESVLKDVNFIYDENLKKYFERNKKNINDLVDCKNCMMPNYKNIICENFMENDFKKIKAPTKKGKRVEVSFTEDEYEFLIVQSEDVGKKIQIYIKEMTLNGNVKKINFDVVNNYMKEMNKIYALLNAYLILAVKTYEYVPEEIIEIQKSIDEIKKLNRKVLRTINNYVYVSRKNNDNSDK